MGETGMQLRSVLCLLIAASLSAGCTTTLNGVESDAGAHIDEGIRADASAQDANDIDTGAVTDDGGSSAMDGGDSGIDAGGPGIDSGGADGGFVAPSCSVNVRDHGAVGDGATNDASAFIAAFAAAGSGGVVCVPTGTYVIGATPLAVPNGVSVRGDGMDVSWIKGRVDFGSDQLFIDLKIGDAGDCALHNQDGADTVRFERCRFHGGGGYDGLHGVGEGLQGPVITIGDDGDASNILFHESIVDRNLGEEIPDHWPSQTNGCNNISITDRWGGPHVAHVTFDHCVVGAFNGIATGAPRAGIEAWCDSISSPGTPDHCWEDINILDSTFEGADMFTLDFSTSHNLGGPVRVERSVIRGAGNMAIPQLYNYALCLECPAQFTIRDNTFYRSRMEAINMANGSDDNSCDGKNLSGSVISGNRFLLDEDNGLSSWDWDVFTFVGNNFEFSDNEVRVNQGPVVGGQVVGVWNSNGVHVSHNTIEDLRTDLSTLMIRVGEMSGGNTFNDNTFITHSGDAPAWQDSGAGNTWSGNTLLTR